jgi:hypothetical protein
MRTAASISALGALLFGATLVGCTSDYEVIPEPVDVDPADVTECEFNPISGTQLSVYDCNPVFTTQSGTLDVDSVGFLTTTVVGHPFYQIWYSATEGSGYELHYAASGDGTNWDDHPSNPLLLSQSGAWDQDIMDAIRGSPCPPASSTSAHGAWAWPPRRTESPGPRTPPTRSSTSSPWPGTASPPT